MSRTDTPAKVASTDKLGQLPERMSFAAVCAMMPEGVCWGDHLTPQIARRLVEAGAAAERERCAAICEQWDLTHPARLAAEIRGA